MYGHPSSQSWDGIHLRGELGQLAYTESVVTILTDILDICDSNKSENNEISMKKNKSKTILTDILDKCESTESESNEPPKKKIKSENMVNSSYQSYCSII